MMVEGNPKQLFEACKTAKTFRVPPLGGRVYGLHTASVYSLTWTEIQEIGILQIIKEG